MLVETVLGHPGTGTMFAAVLAAQAAKPASVPASAFPPPGPETTQKPEYPQKSYEAKFAANAPVLDGKLDDAAWAAAPWTDDFVDIQGPKLPAPRYRTRAKMLWDEQCLYIGAELTEPHVWSTLKKHDEIVFHIQDGFD